MRYYGGGIGHLSNAPTPPVDPSNPPSDEVAEENMEVEDPETDTRRNGSGDVIMQNEDQQELEAVEDEGRASNSEDGEVCASVAKVRFSPVLDPPSENQEPNHGSFTRTRTGLN